MWVSALCIGVVCFSAYCGGMWVAAVKAFVEMAEVLGCSEDKEKWTNILDKAKENFEKKLWNGKFDVI